MRRSALGKRGFELIIDTAQRVGGTLPLDTETDDLVPLTVDQPTAVRAVDPEHPPIKHKRTSTTAPTARSRAHSRKRRQKKGCTPLHLRKRYAQVAERLSVRPVIGQQAAQAYLDTKHTLPAFSRVYVDLVGVSLWHLRDSKLARENKGSKQTERKQFDGNEDSDK